MYPVIKFIFLIRWCAFETSRELYCSRWETFWDSSWRAVLEIHDVEDSFFAISFEINSGNVCNDEESSKIFHWTHSTFCSKFMIRAVWTGEPDEPVLFDWSSDDSGATISVA